MTIIETKIHSLLTIAFPGIDQRYSPVSRMCPVFLTASHPYALAGPAVPLLQIPSLTIFIFLLYIHQIEIHHLHITMNNDAV